MKKKKLCISAIIPVHNDQQYLSNCILSLRHAAKIAQIKLEFIIINNDIKLKEKYFRFPENCKLIFNSSNVGLAKALHQGALIAKGEWLLFLNVDTLTKPNTLKYLLNHIKEEKIAIIAPKIFFPDGILQLSINQEINLFHIFLEQSYLYKLFSFIFTQSKANVKMYRSCHEVKAVEVTYFLMKRSIYNQIGGFDLRFFFYFEDMDLCKRVRDLKYSILFVPYAEVIHFGFHRYRGLSDGKLYTKSLYKYLSKYHSIIYAKTGMIFLLIGCLLRLVYWYCKKQACNRPNMNFVNNKVRYYREITLTCLYLLNLVIC